MMSSPLTQLDREVEYKNVLCLDARFIAWWSVLAIFDWDDFSLSGGTFCAVWHSYICGPADCIIFQRSIPCIQFIRQLCNQVQLEPTSTGLSEFNQLSACSRGDLRKCNVTLSANLFE